MSLQEVEEYVSKVKAAGGNATVHVYPGEGHAFMNSDPDSFKRMDSELRHIMLLSVAYCLHNQHCGLSACQRNTAAFSVTTAGKPVPLHSPFVLLTGSLALT